MGIECQLMGLLKLEIYKDSFKPE
ncbi:hypothetical protein CRE_18761 [Caenorhabditis remanei]|uniref:Uncharacterized protein n=1 Tax=Caenorhabditis remanei TaxID=31234 RepID=E3LK00_CAERE|nr:hypothetical protein CRE_18761 [Caenorhabditis remanei]